MRVIDSTYKLNKNDDILDCYAISSLDVSYSECKSFQLAIKAKEEIRKLDLEIISENNYRVYYEYFHRIDRTSTIFTNPGYYPDCLVPYELFIKNKLYSDIKAGDNLIFNINLNIKSRNSEILKLRLRLNNRVYESELFINVLPISLNKPISLKTVFGIFPEMYKARPSFTLEQYIDAYNSLLNEYRISSNRILASYEDLDLVVKKIISLNDKEDVSTIPLPIVLNSDGMVDTKYIYNNLLRLIDEANKCGKNYLSKLVIYNYMLDEPEPDKFPAVGKFTDDINEIKKKLSPLCKTEELRNTLNKIPNITTVFYRSDLYDRVDTWCPTYVAYQEPELEYEARERGKRGDGAWWYGCVWPMHPYPNFHIDDDLLNIRALAYMQFYYNIEGSLYWAVNIDKPYDLEKKEYVSGSVWDEPMVFPPANGDGYLTYPALRFGSLYPMPSIRLDAIKNSIYDYEYLIKLEENLISLSQRLNLSYDRKSYFMPIFKYLFHGIIAYRDYRVLFGIDKLIKNLIILSEKGIYIRYASYPYEVLVYSKNRLELPNEEVYDSYYLYRLLDNKSYLITDNILIRGIKPRELLLINTPSHYNMSNKEEFIIKLANKINIIDYYNILLNIKAASAHPFTIIAYGINENNLSWPLGYQVISSSDDIYNIAIDLKNTSYYADIDSTALCSRYNLFKDKLKEFLSARVTAIAFEINDYRTFNDKEGRYKDNYSLSINKCVMEKKGDYYD